MIAAMQLAWHHMPAIEKWRILIMPRALFFMVVAAIGGVLAGAALKVAEPHVAPIVEKAIRAPGTPRFDIDRQEMMIPAYRAWRRGLVVSPYITRIQTDPFPNLCHLCGCCWPPSVEVVPALPNAPHHVHVHPL